MKKGKIKEIKASKLNAEEFIEQKVGEQTAVLVGVNRVLMETITKDSDEDIAKMMKDANCYSVRMGVESADPNLREKILKKAVQGTVPKLTERVCPRRS